MRNTLILALLFLWSAVSVGATLDMAGIDAALRTEGQWNDTEKAYRVPLGGGSWAGFQTGKEKPAIMLGEFVLAANQVNPAIDAALAGGLEVMALHGVSLDDPRRFSLHLSGEGEATEMAAALKKVQDAVVATNALRQLKLTKGTDTAITTIPREAVMPCGCKISSTMGVATTMMFEGDKVSGAIPCAYGEVPGVLRALRAGGIEITAIVNHIDAEAPRLLFVHFGGRGDQKELRETIQAAVDSQANRGGAHQHHQH